MRDKKNHYYRHSGENRNPVVSETSCWTPAFAGETKEKDSDSIAREAKPETTQTNASLFITPDHLSGRYRAT